MGYRSNNRSGTVSRYLSEIREFPILSEEGERELSESLHGRDKARALKGLIESNLAFVVKIVSEYPNPVLPFEDLLNEGNIGLIEAAHRFDPTRGTRFLSYAVWWIRKSILRALSEHRGQVRIPLSQMKNVRKVRATEQALVMMLGRMPEREEISRELRTTLAKIDKTLQTKRKELSLDDPIDWDDGTPISDRLVDRGSANPEEELLREETQELISLALKDLSHQERMVVISRFGLEGEETVTLREIGKRLGITAERVRQIEFQAMKRLRKAISRKTRDHHSSAARLGSSPPPDGDPAEPHKARGPFSRIDRTGTTSGPR